MRVSIIGKSVVAQTIRDYAADPAINYAVLDQESDYAGMTLYIEPAQDQNVSIDGSGSLFELNAIKHIQELSTGWPLVLYRKGGKVTQQDRLLIKVPMGDIEKENAVEVGILRALVDTVSAGKAQATAATAPEPLVNPVPPPAVQPHQIAAPEPTAPSPEFKTTKIKGLMEGFKTFGMMPRLVTAVVLSLFALRLL